MRDLVPFVEFKKREKHPRGSVTFSKVAGSLKVQVRKQIARDCWGKELDDQSLESVLKFCFLASIIVSGGGAVDSVLIDRIFLKNYHVFTRRGLLLEEGQFELYSVCVRSVLYDSDSWLDKENEMIIVMIS